METKNSPDTSGSVVAQVMSAYNLWPLLLLLAILLALILLNIEVKRRLRAQRKRVRGLGHARGID